MENEFDEKKYNKEESERIQKNIITYQYKIYIDTRS